MAPITEAKKKQYDLDNPKKVQKITDHGQSLYHRDNRDSRRMIQAPRNDIDHKTLIKELQAELDEAKRWYKLDDAKCFIPCGIFQGILNPEKVLQIVSSLPCYTKKTKDELHRLAQDICFGNTRLSTSRKIVGALVGINKIKDLDMHLKDGLHDSCLPMRSEIINGKYTLRCNIGEHKHPVLCNRYGGDKMENFLKWTRALTAPYITSTEGLHPHYIMGNGSCLPVEFKSEVSNPVDPRARTSQDGGYGGFSEVYKVKICDGHWKFGHSEMRNRKGYFALKKLTSQNRNNFKLELQSLLFSTEQEGRSQKHMIKVLATFEERNSVNNHSTYYLLFDWADGDLEYYWAKNSHLVRDMNHCPWMADQFLGLAWALQTFHNDRRDALQRIPEEVPDEDIYGTHGDVKPKNLLFIRGRLALADFGLGRLNSKLTRSKNEPESLAKTATYRAPEFDLPLGLVGPTSDLYSLGCVFVEHITWFLLGPDSIGRFSKARAETNHFGVDADEFFSINLADDQQPAAVKPMVQQWINELIDHDSCSEYLLQMLELIRDEMLDPNPKTRIRAHRLVEKLERLRKICRGLGLFIRNAGSRHTTFQ